MGTRGVMGIRLDGRDFGSYCHSDAYPDGLGKDMIDGYRAALAEWGLDGIKQRVRALEVMSQDTKPTKKQKEKLAHLADTSVASGKLDNPYCLLRKSQGNFVETLKAGVILNAMSFIQASLHCEWAYFINLDAGTFEVYKGFQEKPHTKGRFSAAEPHNTAVGDYYPCALVAEFPLDDIPQDWIKRVESDE